MTILQCGLVYVFSCRFLSCLPRPLLSQSSHQLVKKFTLLVGGDLLTTAAEVKRVLAKSLVVGSQVDGQRKSAVRADTSASGVQAELADWNTHTVDTQVTETEDTRTVSDDSDLDFMRPVVQD